MLVIPESKCKKVVLILALLSISHQVLGQSNYKDSISVIPLSKYDSVSQIHRWVFGENYRKEYAKSAKVPILYLSRISGGLKAVALGGGKQSRSLRLKDRAGREWSLRSIQKYPEALIPDDLKGTFLVDVLNDNMSAQHPYGALAVPILAEAVGIPHSNPVIGMVAKDEGLGEFAPQFAGTLCLLEEREPLGKSENTARMLQRLKEDNSHSVAWDIYLKAKALDVLLGDWDRHEDQWRWKTDTVGQNFIYQPVPRDRDQVFFRSDGQVQRFTQSSWLLPMMQGYERDLKNINWFLWEGRNMNTRIFSSVSAQQWDAVILEFCHALPDSILRLALSKMPMVSNPERTQQLLEQLKARRDQMPLMMQKYYRFFNKIVDIELSDRAENVLLHTVSSGNLEILVQRTSDRAVTFKRTFQPEITHEIRLFLHGGQDSVEVDSISRKFKVRIVSGADAKKFNLSGSAPALKLYGKPSDLITINKYNDLRKRISTDTANIGYLASERYKRRTTLANVGFNKDDGLMLGLVHMFTLPGFRKTPYASIHKIAFLYALNTSAFNFSYKGEWPKAVGKADLLMDMDAFAPNNTRNFFGLGNQTSYLDSGEPITFYRARYNLSTLRPALRFHLPKSTISLGAVLEYYSFNKAQNSDRFIARYLEPGNEEIPDIDRSKIHGGLNVQYALNTRDSEVLPKSGLLLKSNIDLEKGLNGFSDNMASFDASLSMYLKVGSGDRVVLANRIGGGFTLGRPEFYQGYSLGGMENLTGYRQFRFTGNHSVYNNFELRLKIGNVFSYILPGEFGLLGIYDVGRVWQKEEHSTLWHHGLGSGIYFSPAKYFYFNAVAGYSREGWYPTLALKSRF